MAVIAEHMWAAKQGLAALDIQWDEGPNAKLSSADIVRELETASQKPGVVARRDGDFATAVAKAANKIEAVYQMPFLAHAAMEPMNCTVHVRKDDCELVGILAGPDPRSGRRCEGDRPAAREGAGSQPSAGRRFGGKVSTRSLANNTKGYRVRFAALRAALFPRWRNGRAWRVRCGYRASPSGDVQGYCDDARRAIWISPQLTGNELDAAIVHEMVHAVAGSNSAALTI